MKNAAYVILAVVLIVGCLSFKTTSPEDSAVANVGSIVLASPAFKNGELIPRNYTCDGIDVNPPLQISGVPAGAKSLALVVDDPDAPMGVFNHWLVWNIDPAAASIPANTVPAGAVQGLNDFRKNSYGGPCPPYGTHRYLFKIYALDAKLELSSASGELELLKAMEGHISAQTQLVGIYKK